MCHVCEILILTMIKCEHPRIIFHPYLQLKFSQGFYHLVSPTGEKIYQEYGHMFFDFPWKDFIGFRSSCTIDNYKQFYLLNDDGEIFYFLLLVPCGKCRLCRKKKVEDLQTRCMCESMTSDYPPLFITLTYRPDCRPSSMLQCEDDFVKFMKRLRINVERYTRMKQSLRFLAVSEWTPGHHYPHIHMLLWNMPFISPAPGDVNSFWKLIDFVQNDCWQHGITKVERCRDTSGQYVLKYMTKDTFKSDNLDESCWLHSSRRPGIGFYYAARYISRITDNNFDYLTISVRDGRGKLVRRGFPAYFKRLVFPSASQVFPSRISKALKDFTYDAAICRYFFARYNTDTQIISRLSEFLIKAKNNVFAKYYMFPINHIDCRPDVETMHNISAYCHNISVIGKLRFLHTSLPRWSSSTLPWDPPEDDFTPDYEPKIKFIDENKPFLSSMQNWLSDVIVNLILNYRILSDYQFDAHAVSELLRLHDLHSSYVENIVFPDVDVQSCVDAYEREQQWMRSHWMQQEIG